MDVADIAGGEQACTRSCGTGGVRRSVPKQSRTRRRKTALVLTMTRLAAVVSVMAASLVMFGVTPAAAATAVSITGPVPDGLNGWYRAQPTMTITASDSGGISSLSYTWGGPSTTVNYTSPYPTSAAASTSPPAPGTATLAATALDSSGAATSTSTTVSWDPDPPSQPSNAHWGTVDGVLTTTASGTSPCMFWTGSIDAVSGVRQYHVQVSETPDFATIAIDRTTGSTATSMCLSPSDVQAGNTYYFRVAGQDTAGNESGFSPPSARVGITDQTTGPALAHAPVPTAFVGQDIPISLVASCHTGDACSARVYYESTPISGLQVAGLHTWPSVDLQVGLSQSVNGIEGQEWHGTIPGSAVTSTGVDYFVEAEDNFATTDVPGTTYTASTGSAINEAYHVTAVSPPVITHAPVTISGASQDIPIEAQATCSAPSCTATLYYRTTTDGIPDQPLLTPPAWPRTTMNLTSAVALSSVGSLLTFDSTIPASVVDTRGVDYFISVTDGTTTAWFPGTTFEGYYAPTDGMRTGYLHVHVLEPPHLVHTPTTVAYLNETIHVTAQATCSTPNCSGQLSYRTSTGLDTLSGTIAYVTDPAPYTTVAMTATVLADSTTGTTAMQFDADIPGDVVNTNGVDYQIDAFDGYSHAYWPGAPQAAPLTGDGLPVAWQHVEVFSRPTITHVPPATYTIGLPLQLTADVTAAAGFPTVTLEYRMTGDLNYQSIPMTVRQTAIQTSIGSLYTVTGAVPGDFLAQSGTLEYFIDVNDTYQHTYAPAYAGDTLIGYLVAVSTTPI